VVTNGKAYKVALFILFKMATLDMESIILNCGLHSRFADSYNNLTTPGIYALNLREILRAGNAYENDELIDELLSDEKAKDLVKSRKELLDVIYFHNYGLRASNC